MPTGTKKYLIKETPYYRHGRLFPVGSTVEIPADEKPARSWVEVTDDELEAESDGDEQTPEEAAEAEVNARKGRAGRGKRPSDSSPA